MLTIEKINHLRDALAANMVGIIAHLYKTYPGIIALENLSEENLANHFLKSNENIGRRLEWRLYNKFSNLGLVPPAIKESVLLREEKGITQFGLIHFIPTPDTSKNCPYCGRKNQKNENDWKNDKDNKRLFECIYGDCGFNTRDDRKGLEALSDPDMVASYNVAISAYQFIINPPSRQNSKKPDRNTQKAGQNKKERHKRSGAGTKPKARTRISTGATSKPFANLKEMMDNRDG